VKEGNAIGGVHLNILARNREGNELVMTYVSCQRSLYNSLTHWEVWNQSFLRKSL